MAMITKFEAEQDAVEPRINAWLEQAIADGVARVALRAYIGCWRRQVFPRPEFSPEPFAILCRVMEIAYPERSRGENATLALETLYWVRRVHGYWFSREISRPVADAKSGSR